MKNKIWIGLLAGGLWLASLNLHGADSTAKAVALNHLEPLAFLAGHEWEAKLPAKPDGTQPSIIARLSWSENHQAIRISNSFNVAGKSIPYIDGLYTWNPQKKSIMFIYVDAGGTLTQGLVNIADGVLVHEFQTADSDGKIGHYRARATPQGVDAWTNEISEVKDGKSIPMVTVRYEKIK